jgi:hypothetical protein
MDLLAGAEAALEEARSRPPAYLSTRRYSSPDPSAPRISVPPDSSAEGITSPVSVVPAPISSTGVDLSQEAQAAAAVPWATREAVLSEWELSIPVVDGFATRVDMDEAKRRAALVLLAATLPLGPLAPAMRLALGTRRGQVFMDLHESDGTLWISKERFEELARFLEEREVALGHTTDRSAAPALAALAEREGYRAERIAAKLGPLPPQPPPPPAPAQSN